MAQLESVEIIQADRKQSGKASLALPRIEDLFARLAGGKKFTKLDIDHAYPQIPLDKDLRSSVTINTHKGLFRYNCLPFGVHSMHLPFSKGQWKVC